jgi:hypothetical protein
VSHINESGRGDDAVSVSEHAAITDSGQWRCKFTIADYEGEIEPAELDKLEPIRVVETDNLLMNIGVSALWEYALGNGTATAGQALTYINAANAAIGAGNGTTAEAATQTNLQGASRLRKGMNSGYPAHTHGSATANKTITLQSTFGTAEANFDWAEVACFASTTDATGPMLNRKVQAIGVKSSSVSRVVTCEVQIS